MLAYCVGKLPNGRMCNPIACEVDVSKHLLHNLGNGYRGYFVETPWPGMESCVIDSRTGAVLGHTLAQVREQIKTYKVRYDGVSKTALRIKAQAAEVPPEQFWSWIIQILNSVEGST